MALFPNLGGTSETSFRVGLLGPLLKRISGTQLAVRNTADSAYAAVQALLFQTFGDDFELNAGATSAGADWKFTMRRPSTGMTTAVVLVMPASGTPTVGMALTVASVSAGVITLAYTTVASGTDSAKVDTTTIAFGSTSPVAMFNNPAGGVVRSVSVTIDTAFNGAPSLSVGIAGTVSKYMPATAVDLTAAAGTVFQFTPGTAAAGGVEAIIATYAAGAASAGAARVEVEYVIPS